jgi:proline dehydrogenase
MNFVRRFVIFGENQMRSQVSHLKTNNITPIFDYAIEHTGRDSTREVKKNITDMVEKYPGNFVAIKLSALDLYGSKIEDNIESILQVCKDTGTKVKIDAEEDIMQKDIDMMANKILAKHNNDNVHVFKTYQMYRRDALHNLRHDIKLYEQLGISFSPYLVRGAYHGFDRESGALFDKINDTHNSFDRGMESVILSMVTNNTTSLAVGTHNRKSIKRLKRYINIDVVNTDLKDRVYFSHLMGFSNEEFEELAKEGYNVLRYIPFGPFFKVYPYLLRRFIENYEQAKHI